MRIVSNVTVSLLVLSLVVPAGLAAAGPSDPAEPSPATSAAVAAPARAVVQTPDVVSHAAIARATSAIAREQGVQAPIHSPAKTHQVRQQGGGSKAGMITALVATVGGLVGTIYMINYMKDQENKAQSGS